MRPKRYWLTYLYTSIWDVPSWLVLLILWSLWGTRLHWLEGIWFEFKVNSWPMRTLFKGWGGVTFGHGGCLAPGLAGEEGIDTVTEYHEHVHVEQYEASMLRSFMVGIAAGITVFLLGHVQEALILGGALWFSGAMLTWVAGWIQAVLRGEKAYLGSYHEEAAYSLAREYARKQHGLD